MDILPVEIVEMIVRQLTPQDLARCSAVCREWREIFNQDWMWKPHCDPELEEPLRTIPCVATPAFVAPETGDSALSPICCWKLAFLRENRLWKNWRCKEKMKYKEENVVKFRNKSRSRIRKSRYILYIDFLTDTLVVAGYSNRIQVLDVSVMPATLVAKTRVKVGWNDELKAVGPNMVLLETDYSIEVFNVDVINRSIFLKHSIPLYYDKHCDGNRLITEECFYLMVNSEKSKLVIVDLNTGEKLKEELPMKVNENDCVTFSSIKGSPSTNLLVVTFHVFTEDHDEYYEYHVYNPKELTFLPGPVAENFMFDEPHNIALHDHRLAVIENKTLKVYNIQTREVLLSHEEDYGWHGTYVCNNNLIFVGYERSKSWVKSYLPFDRSLATLSENDFGSFGPDRKLFEVINKKFLALFGGASSFAENVWKPSAKSVEKCDISVKSDFIINRSFTKVLSSVYFQDSGTIDWYVISLW